MSTKNLIGLEGKYSFNIIFILWHLFVCFSIANIRREAPLSQYVDSATSVFCIFVFHFVCIFDFILLVFLLQGSVLHRSTFVTVLTREAPPSQNSNEPDQKTVHCQKYFALPSICQKQQSCVALNNSNLSLKPNSLSLSNSLEYMDEWEVKVKEGKMERGDRICEKFGSSRLSSQSCFLPPCPNF